MAKMNNVRGGGRRLERNTTKTCKCEKERNRRKAHSHILEGKKRRKTRRQSEVLGISQMLICMLQAGNW